MISRKMSALFVAVMCGAPNCATQPPPSLTGTWSFTVKTRSATASPAVTFTQRDEVLTGHYSSMTWGDADLTGTIRKKSVTFTVFANYEGDREDLTFTGKYDGRAAIKGNYSNSFGEGTFTAIRQ